MSDNQPESALPTAPATRSKKNLYRWAAVVLLLLILLTFHWLLFQGNERVPGVITRPLGPCDVNWFMNKGGVLVLGCPHMDMLELWPLPVQQPWYEDSLILPATAIKILP